MAALEFTAGIIIAGTAGYLGVAVVRANPELTGPAIVIAVVIVISWILSTAHRVTVERDRLRLREAAEARRTLFAGHDPLELREAAAPKRTVGGIR